MNREKEVKNIITMMQNGQIQLSEALFHIAGIAEREEKTIFAEPSNKQAQKRLSGIHKALGI